MAHHSRHSAPPGAVAVWVGGPAALLVGLALDVRLSLNWPREAASWALPAVLVLQVLLSALLSASLLRSARTTGTALAAGLPLLLAAGALGEGDAWAIVRGAGWLTVWLTGLWLLVSSRPGRRWSGVVTFGVTLLVVAGPLLLYLSGSGRVGVGRGDWLFHFPPLPGVVVFAGGIPSGAAGWREVETAGAAMVPLGVPLGLAAVGFFLKFPTLRRKPAPQSNRFSTRNSRPSQ